MKKILLLILSFATIQVSAQTWTQLGNPPASYEARNHPITFSIGDFGYITTGAGNFYNSDFYRYDPTNDSWTPLANFPGGARSFGYGVSNNGKGYAGFGLVQNSSGVIYYDDLWEFDPSDNSWTQLASCPGIGRRHPAMVATPGKIWVGCGDGTTGNLKDWWEYDIATNIWTQRADLPGPPRHHPYFFDIAGDAYVGFGHNGQNIYKDMYKFDPSTLAWTAIPSLPAQGRVAGTQFSFNNKGYLLSGQGEDHRNLATGEMWEYDPATNAWTSKTAHPGTGRWAPGSFVIGSTVYFTSGAGFGNSQIDISDMWKFDMPFPLSVKNIEAIDFNIYPNPAKNSVTISTEDQIENITVTTISGQHTSVQIDQASQQNTKLDLSSLTPGVYVLTVKTAKGQSSERLMVQ